MLDQNKFHVCQRKTKHIQVMNKKENFRNTDKTINKWIKRKIHSPRTDLINPDIEGALSDKFPPTLEL